MPRNTVAILSLSCSTLFVAYVALVVATMVFAGLQTGLAREVRASESRIATLETEYYDAIERLSFADLTSHNLVSPKETAYVSLHGRPTFTRADR